MIRKILPLILSLFAAASLAFAQQTVRPVPDCVSSFPAVTGTGAIASSLIDNRQQQCNVWVLTWEVYGASAAVNATFQQAPSNNVGTGAGTFVTFAGTTVSGSNPSASISNRATFTGFAPWVQVSVTSITGTLRGLLLGWRAPGNVSEGGGGGGPTANVNIVASIPLDVNVLGTPTVQYATTCTNKASFNVFATPGNQQIVAAVGGQTVKICHISFSADGTTDFVVTSGTGSNCGTGTFNVTGTYKSLTQMALDRDVNTINAPVSQAVCLNFSAAVNVGGFVLYSQQ